MAILSTRPNYHQRSGVKEKVLTIYVGNTYIAFKCSRYGLLDSGMDISKFIKRNLTEYNYNYRMKRYVVAYQYSRYQPKMGMIRMPRHLLKNLLSYLGDKTPHTIKELHPPDPRVVEMDLLSGVSPREHQEAILKFLDTEEAFKPIGVFTGGGKSFMAIAGIVMKKHPAIIVLPGLISQWYRSIREFTDIDKNDIFVVQGFDRLRLLVDLVEGGYIPKIVIFSTRTLVMYCSNPEMPYSEILDYESLMAKIGTGTKIIDEVHMNFNANVLVDLQSLIKYNIYLSATYQRSNDNARRIFDKVFPLDLIYGDAIGDKYTEVFLSAYSMPIGEFIDKVSTNNGYNHALYEKVLMSNMDLFREFADLNLVPLINSYFTHTRKEGQKLLILCATRDMTKLLLEHLQEKFSFSMAIFFSGDKGEIGDEQVFVNYDAVISTHKSCGTGRDIKNLKTCINTLSFASAPLANQVMGRLRKLPDDVTYFVDMYNTEVPTHLRHLADRKSIYRLKAKAIHDIKTT